MPTVAVSAAHPEPPALPAAPRRAPSLSQQVVEGLAERIRSGSLKPGARVPTEPELMQQFGVSRSVVREAISRLQAGGLVRTHQGVGSFVLEPPLPAAAPALLQTPDAALKLQQKLAMLELRVSVEAEAAALAAQRRTPQQLRQMERALEEFDAQLATGDGTAEADFRFHEAIAQATGNEYFVHVLRTLSGATIPRAPARPPSRPASRAAARGGAPRGAATRTSAKAPRFGEPSPQLRSNKELAAQEHRAVLDAIRRSDAAMARAAMYMHLNNSRERMKSASR
jgi:GntR family transcriptional regulator, transcriptional repressor for pyruvate dehydrogenase complex